MSSLIRGAESEARSYRADLGLLSGSSKDLDLRIVCLVRDMRSWSSSRYRDAQPRPPAALPSFIEELVLG